MVEKKNQIVYLYSNYLNEIFILRRNAREREPCIIHKNILLFSEQIFTFARRPLPLPTTSPFISHFEY